MDRRPDVKHLLRREKLPIFRGITPFSGPIPIPSFRQAGNNSAQRFDFLIAQPRPGEHISDIAHHTRPFFRRIKETALIELAFKVLEK